MSANPEVIPTDGEVLLSPEAEADIQSALNLLRAGSDAKTVLRTLYCLARMDGMLTITRKS